MKLLVTCCTLLAASCVPPVQDPCASVTCAQGRRCVAGVCVSASPDTGLPFADTLIPDTTHIVPAADLSSVQDQDLSGDLIPDTSVDASPCVPGSKEVRIRAYIDGVSRIKIQDNKLWWHHLIWYPPGYLNAPPVQPTYVNGKSWLPTWPFSGSGKDCNCESDKYDLCDAGVQLGAQPTLDQVQTVASRGVVAAVVYPFAANNYLTVVQIADTPYLADWHEIVVKFK